MMNTSTQRGRVSLRVLVADDNVDTAKSIASLLKFEGFDVRTAFDGNIAFDAAISFRPDVLILDIRMPRLDGLQLAKRLRQLPEFAGTLFIAHSGYSDQTHLDQASRATFDEFLIKPFSWQILLEILDEASERFEQAPNVA